MAMPGQSFTSLHWSNPADGQRPIPLAMEHFSPTVGTKSASPPNRTPGHPVSECARAATGA